MRSTPYCISFFAAAMALFSATWASAQSSLLDALTARTATAEICVGCILELELLRVYLTWETTADLDMHVFGPGPTGRREIYYGNRVGTEREINDPFGAQRCDDLGRWSKTCGIRGERFTVRNNTPRVERDGPDSDRYPYCVGLRTYSSPNASDQWLVVISVDGATEWTCSGTLRMGQSISAVDLGAIAPVCAEQFRADEHSFGAIIELHPLRVPHRLGDSPPLALPTEIKCEAP